jgi:hypothetical protein
MAVALRNVRGGQAALFADHVLALAGAGDPLAPAALTTRTRPTPSQMGQVLIRFKPSAWISGSFEPSVQRKGVAACIDRAFIALLFQG